VLHVEAKASPRSAQGAGANGSVDARRSADAQTEEAVGLALAINLNVVETLVVNLAKPHPATLIGPGKVEEFKGLMAALEIELVVVNGHLSPVQQRNLETAWTVKVLDRAGLILEIFGERARTKEGRLQVELAHLTYQKSRLVRSWTHLERQRGGLGFVGGPGETQIEADRRMIQARIGRIEKRLETVKRTRKLHRTSRSKVPYPIVALVGYTNAGKSTLFNTLTDAEVDARDQLFATLDPTMRHMKLPSGRSVVLSDTVGFISNLPTDLIAAFRATLEEVLEADMIIHVRDITHEDSDAQAGDVEQVLANLGIEESRRQSVVEVWNKIDLLPEQTRDIVEQRSKREGGAVVMVSAQSGEGLDMLRDMLDKVLGADNVNLDVIVDAIDGAGLHWLYENAEVLSRSNLEDGSVEMNVRISPAKAGVARDMFATVAPA
jgi:GTP-binding protein HflX